MQRQFGTCAGYCTFACALLAHVIDHHGLQVTTVAGTYVDEFHWWLEVDQQWRVDPTRSQFDQGPLVEAVETPSAYQVLERYENDWTGEEAAVAFAAFFAGETGYQAIRVWQTLFPKADAELARGLMDRCHVDVDILAELMAAADAASVSESEADESSTILRIEELLRSRLADIDTESVRLRSAIKQLTSVAA